MALPKKKYISSIDREKKLSELIVEEEQAREKEIKKKPKIKIKPIKLLSCAECEFFTLKEVKDGKTYGTFSCGGKCVHMFYPRV
jgi:hypothetical protein